MEFPRTVFVLGAGFTKAFLPDAPLLTDTYTYAARGMANTTFRHFQTARNLLFQELNRNKYNKINLERLLTRLDGGMPYDSEQGTREELQLFLRHVKQSFLFVCPRQSSGRDTMLS